MNTYSGIIFVLCMITYFILTLTLLIYPTEIYISERLQECQKEGGEYSFFVSGDREFESCKIEKDLF